MANDLVSVIMPVYNGEKTLKEAIDSVLSQTYANLELIIVNDGSTDSSLAIAREYESKHPQVRVVDKPNGGASSARNAGLKAAVGEYICFCDADDMYNECFVEILRGSMVQDGVDWVWCNPALIIKGKIVPRKIKLKSGIYSHETLTDIVVDDGAMTGVLISSNGTILYKRSVIREHEICFDESVFTGEDGVFNLKYFFHTKKLRKIDDALYYVRPTPATGKKRFEEVDVFGPANKAIEKICRGKIKNLDEQMLARKASIALWSIIIACQRYSRKSAIAEIKRILEDTSLEQAYPLIKIPLLHPLKRPYLFLMKRKCSRILWFITRYGFKRERVSRDSRRKI